MKPNETAADKPSWRRNKEDAVKAPCSPTYQARIFMTLATYAEVVSYRDQKPIFSSTHIFWANIPALQLITLWNKGCCPRICATGLKGGSPAHVAVWQPPEGRRCEAALQTMQCPEDRNGNLSIIYDATNDKLHKKAISNDFSERPRRPLFLNSETPPVMAFWQSGVWVWAVSQMEGSPHYGIKTLTKITWVSMRERSRCTILLNIMA